MISSKMNITDDKLGLKTGDLEAIINVLRLEKDVEEAVIFGSRAKGNYKHGSDVDIALKGRAIDHDIVNHISFTLNEETIMPYHFDVINYHKIASQSLVDHINRVGIVFYTANS